MSTPRMHMASGLPMLCAQPQTRTSRRPLPSARCSPLPLANPSPSLRHHQLPRPRSWPPDGRLRATAWLMQWLRHCVAVVVEPCRRCRRRRCSIRVWGWAVCRRARRLQVRCVWAAVALARCHWACTCALVWLRRRGHFCWRRRRCCCVVGGEWAGASLHALRLRWLHHPPHSHSDGPTAQPHPGDAELDDGLPPLPCGGDAAFAALGWAIAEVGVDVCHWGEALRLCVLGLGVVPSASGRLAGRRFPVTVTAAGGGGTGGAAAGRAGAARSASGGDGDGDGAWGWLVRRHSARLHDSVSGRMLGRAALSGVGCVVGWMFRSSSGVGSGGREWVWGRMPGAVLPNAEKLLGVVLRGVDTGHRLEVVAPSTASGACVQRGWCGVASHPHSVFACACECRRQR